MVESEALEKLGLTQNEIIIYIHLIRRGISTGPEIYQENGLDKSSAYEAITSLQRKGLVFSLGQKRNQTFGAYPAEKLRDLVVDKTQELEQVKHTITAFMADLDAYAKTTYKGRNVKIYSGNDEFLTWAKDRLTVPKGETIRKISSTKLQSKFIADYDAYSVQMPKWRVARGINMKEIYTAEDLEFHKHLQSLVQTDPKLLKRVRKFPDKPKFEIPASFATYSDKIAFLRQQDKQFFGVIITDKLISKLMQQMFDFIWHFCEDV